MEVELTTQERYRVRMLVDGMATSLRVFENGSTPLGGHFTLSDDLSNHAPSGRTLKVEKDGARTFVVYEGP